MYRALICLMIPALSLGCRPSGPTVPPLPWVVIETALGPVTVEIDTVRAPITATNFLRYVDEARFDSAAFYRVVRMDNQPRDSVRIEVIQGGLGDRSERLGLAPIPHETTAVTGLRHADGTISMARMTPGTSSSEIFICVGAQPDLDFGGRRNPDGQGFAAFGQVVSGMDVVRAIQAGAVDGQRLLEPVPFRVARTGGPSGF